MGKLAIGIPWNHQFVPTAFLWEIIDKGIASRDNVEVIKADKYMLAASRNHIVKEAIDRNCDEILFLDVDQGFPSDVVARLRSHKKDIVSGMVPSRKWPHPFEMYGAKEQDGAISYMPVPIKSHLQKVDGIGFGCVLVKTSVFDNVEAPWFFDLWDSLHINRRFGNDLYFCKKAQDAGYEIYVDTTCECVHDLNVRIDKKYAEENIKYHLMAAEAKKKAEKRIITPEEAAIASS